ncbi:hypothetical protein TorRG33x02_117030, partial [Trema orientale]
LFRLWIAVDFVKAREGKTLMEEAERYLNELVERNLVSLEIIDGVFIDGKKSEFGENKYRRISVYGSTETIPKSIKLNSGVRSIFLFSFNDELINMSSLPTLFQNFKLLKVLDFQFAPLDNLPKKVGNLFHLRVKIQNGFGYLENLETLEDVEVHLDWVVFAKELEKLSKLKRLGVSNLSEESTRAMISAATKKLNHLEHLSLRTDDQDKILDVEPI